VSSTNWSHYSITQNNEVAVIIWSQEVNRALTHYFNKMMAQATRYEAEATTRGLALARGLPVYPAEGVEILANRDYFPQVHRLFQTARKRIDVVQMEAMYYMVSPGHARESREAGEPASLTNVLLRDLVDAKARGVAVRVILDVQENRANPNLDFANRLLAHGVPVYFDSPEVQSHCKLIIVDDDMTILGSTNWSYNAIQEGNEVSVLIRSRAVAEQYRAYFEGILKSGAPVVAGVDLTTTPSLHSQN
jgi:phosphatidylserine/phosphatidylglycerophosphate/cardiolipin synthase-like enzyme